MTGSKDSDREPAELPVVEIIRDAGAAGAALKPPRPAILAALREPASASALAQRLGLPRQLLNHHIRELEAVGLVRLVEQRRRRGCVERVVQATAQRYLLSPDLLGEPGTPEPEDLLRLGHLGWLPLAAVAAQAIRDLETLRLHLGDEVPALTLPAQVRFSSPTAFHDFVRELSEEMARLVAKYHDETAASGRHWFFLGAYPEVGPSAPRPD